LSSFGAFHLRNSSACAWLLSCAIPWPARPPAVMIVDGKQQYLFDEKGRRYLDVS
jgi:acetylornithine/succinyldiaminopimelate/putrescine aminotransferase